MTFLLKDIPGRKTFEDFAKRYPVLDPTAVEAFLRIMRVGSDYLEYLDALLSRHGLLHGRWITLILLMREDDRRALPSALAEKQGVSRATISGLLDGLERDGFVERIAHETDKRQSWAQLTTRGAAKLDEVMPEYYAKVSELMQGYNREQLETLTELLRNAPQPR
jgi:DNA-binding MarR family transcriptional regulator